jgi:protein arginine kinase activator
MNCSQCGQPATHKEVIIKGGKSVDIYFCDRCARRAGAGPALPVPVAQVFIQAVQGAAGAAMEKAAAVMVCPACGLTFAQFRHDGRLGCPGCYTAFEAQLGPLLERAHEGGTHHIGKVPRRAAALRAAAGGATPATGAPPAGGAEGAGNAGNPAPPTRAAAMLNEQERQQRLGALRRQLAEAVQAEQYERAARLRDEVRRLESQGTQGP